MFKGPNDHEKVEGVSEVSPWGREEMGQGMRRTDEHEIGVFSCHY